MPSMSTTSVDVSTDDSTVLRTVNMLLGHV